MTLRSSILLSACVAFLVSCTNGPLQERALSIALDEEAGGAAGGEFPRFQQLLAVGQGPALDVRIVASGIRGGFLREGKRGHIESWLGNDGVGLTFDRGLLHGTRGVGAGLLASDVSASAFAINAGLSGDVERIHTFLNGNDEAISRAYACRIENEGSETIQLDIGAISTRRMTETCVNLDQEFTNTYWVGRGRVLKSQQWAGEFTGDLLITTVYNF